MKTKAYFDEFARKLDALAWNVDTAPWAKWAWGIVEQEVGTAERQVIVDLGTGTGAGIQTMLRFTSNARFIGVDFSEQMIRRARRKSYPGAVDVRFIVSRLDRLHLPAKSVDVTVSSGTFHHIKNKCRVVAGIIRMLKPGGKFINIDHFRAGPRYQKEVNALRRKNPQLAAANDEARAAVQWIYDQDRNHPMEFHTDPYEFARMLERSGFICSTVHVAVQPGYAVVSARKPDTEE